MHAKERPLPERIQGLGVYIYNMYDISNDHFSKNQTGLRDVTTGRFQQQHKKQENCIPTDQ